MSPPWILGSPATLEVELRSVRRDSAPPETRAVRGTGLLSRTSKLHLVPGTRKDDSWFDDDTIGEETGDFPGQK